MENRSKVVMTERKNQHQSRLAKSIQSISNLKDYSIKPDGVWGSKAIIRFPNTTIDSDEIDLEFNIPFDDNLEANEGEIIIYNLSDETIKQLKAKARTRIIAGYVGDTGVIFDGYITKKAVEREGADKRIILKVIDDIGEKKSLNRSYAGGVTAKYILKDLLNEVGIPIAVFKVKRDWTYENDVTIDEPLESAIEKYAEVCGVSAFTSCGKLYCCELKDVARDGYFNVSEETGMIGSPTPYEETNTSEDYEDVIEGYDIDMLLQYRMAAGAKIKLRSKQYNGEFYVRSGEHVFNESECVTRIKVM